jgi:4-carboxymuconolactone decarboxylase
MGKDTHMAETAAFKTGNEIRRKLMGDAYVERMAKTVYTDDVMGRFGAYATEAVFGMLWSRPGLDLKTRTLICVVSDTVMGRPEELKIHLRMALRQGWTEDELVEAILHLGGYAGLPLAREALLTARETFQEIRSEE